MGEMAHSGDMRFPKKRKREEGSITLPPYGMRMTKRAGSIAEE